MQRSITITLNDNQVHWKSDGDGRETLWVMCDALVDMYRYYFKEPLRPAFQPQPARVCIEVEDDRLAIAYRPEDDQGMAKAVTAAALVALSEDAGSTDPFRVMFGALVRDIPMDENGHGGNG